MSRSRKGLLTAAAASLLLFFGVGLSTATADHFGRGARFHGRFFAPHSSFHGRFFAPRAHFVVHSRPFVRSSRSFYRLYYAPYPYFIRPHRVVRAFVSYPYPRYAYRRVYYGGYGSECW